MGLSRHQLAWCLFSCTAAVLLGGCVCDPQHHVHSNHTSKLRLLHSTPIASPVAAPSYYPSYPGNHLGYCSCANPHPVPLELSGADEATAELQGRRRHHEEPEHDDGLCHVLPTSPRHGECGADIGVCPKGYCCSQSGQCTKDPAGCDGTCQCRYSGVGSGCKGSVPFTLPLKLPVAKPGALCGAYVATCPRGQCCSQFGFCVNDTSIYCMSPSCLPAASLMSERCVEAHTSSSDVASVSAQPSATTMSSPNYSYQRGKVRRFTWFAAWKDLAPDGFTRPVIVINGQPFTTLEVDVDDRIIVSVTNLLNEPLSVHWHGMLQRRTNIMDGVVPVTQRPVQPGETYVYNFIADTPGTFWWHSHYSTQYVDGLWGSLIIRAPTAKAYPVDQVVAINDWYHDLANNLTNYYLSPESGGDEPVPNTALFNGHGQGYCGSAGQPACEYSRVRGVAAPCSNPLTKLRVINSGAFAVFNFSIDAHRMIIVAEDGTQIEPVEVGSFQINNGQRYDVLVCQDGPVLTRQPVWMRAVMIDDNFAYPSDFNTTLGVLYYRDEDANTLPTSEATFIAPALRPDVAPNGVDTIGPYRLRTVGGVVPPGPATMSLEYVIFFYNEPEWNPNATQYAHFNRISLQMQPEAPNLIERYTNNPQGLPPPVNVRVPPGGKGWHVVDIPLGSIVDIVINNHDTGEHPIHLHGHWFWVMDAGLPNAGDYNASSNTAGLFGHLARDTVTVNLKSYLVLRYPAVNPGMWIMHCHIDWHLAGGLGIVFKEGFPPYPSGDDQEEGNGGAGYDHSDGSDDGDSHYGHGKRHHKSSYQEGSGDEDEYDRPKGGHEDRHDKRRRSGYGAPAEGSLQDEAEQAPEARQ